MPAELDAKSLQVFILEQMTYILYRLGLSLRRTMSRDPKLRAVNRRTADNSRGKQKRKRDDESGDWDGGEATNGRAELVQPETEQKMLGDGRLQEI